MNTGYDVQLDIVEINRSLSAIPILITYSDLMTLSYVIII